MNLRIIIEGADDATALAVCRSLASLSIGVRITSDNQAALHLETDRITHQPEYVLGVLGRDMEKHAAEVAAS